MNSPSPLLYKILSAGKNTGENGWKDYSGNKNVQFYLDGNRDRFKILTIDFKQYPHSSKESLDIAVGKSKTQYLLRNHTGIPGLQARLESKKRKQNKNKPLC